MENNPISLKACQDVYHNLNDRHKPEIKVLSLTFHRAVVILDATIARFVTCFSSS